MKKFWLEDDVEIQTEKSGEVAEEPAELRIGDIAMHVQRIVAIRQVESAQRKPKSVFRIDLKVARNAAVQRKELRHSQTVGFTDELLVGAQFRIRKAVAEFDNW